MSAEAMRSVVRGDEAETLLLPKNVTRLLAEGPATNGAFSVIRASLEPGAEGARPHHHKKATELFFVVSGAVDILAGSEIVTARAGDLAAVPPMAMHAFANASATEPLDVLIIFGRAIERFGYFRLLRDVVSGKAPFSEVLASQERYDNWFGESPAWSEHLAALKQRGGRDGG